MLFKTGFLEHIAFKLQFRFLIRTSHFMTYEKLTLFRNDLQTLLVVKQQGNT